MLLSTQFTPASRCCRRRSYPPLKPSARLHPKNPILAPLRPPKLHLGENPTAWGYRGVAMTELTRFGALGRGKGMEEDGGTGEAQAILEREAPDLARRFSWRDVEPFINKMTKWIVSGLFGLLILWKHDAESMWVAMGSVLNSMLSIYLKRILNHERPVAGLRSDPGMPSSHAQSIFYIDVTVILLMFHSIGLNPYTVTVGSIALFIGSYLAWLRVSQKLHTSSQVLVGALVGTTFAIVWFELWNSFVLEAFSSHLWVQILVIMGSLAFCFGFVIYVIRYWLRDES
ncbi:lipid phosphate phosphatase epsilon 1, chloroplastic-like isoform X1 [Zingiber officinale]|uniref:lipid phosphate phosphatase epsilon 1, chloroplastic-like isoform X1 n=1 Tax=Zingiber officinale TaxID=94328 RepID=UPI001C4B1EAF|nr:lipid phosphate phosphatase epsilon 1, chloroplastic-like isoform X1 [Zingiber officinale]